MVKWERLKPGLYRWLGKNSCGIYLLMVERGCDKKNWYWTACEIHMSEVKIGKEFTLNDAKIEALKAKDLLMENENGS